MTHQLTSFGTETHKDGSFKPPRQNASAKRNPTLRVQYSADTSVVLRISKGEGNLPFLASSPFLLEAVPLNLELCAAAAPPPPTECRRRAGAVFVTRVHVMLYTSYMLLDFCNAVYNEA